jgi:predicted phage terminase large subunit-like protein
MEKKSKQMSVEEIFDVMLKDKRVRLNIVKRSHKFFFYFYFPHYTEFPIAPFHEEMFHTTQDTNIRSAVILGFRGCGKSTLLTLSFPLWAILGEQKIKHVLILSKTQQKAQTLLQQIKYELETNELLKKDLGPFQEERNGWNLVSLYLPYYDAKITAASTEQSIRGIRHKQYRPQLIICDDLEDMDSVRTKEGRDKIYNWLIGDVIPAGSRYTRLMIVGSLLHEDSLIKRLQKNIEENKMRGIYREYPLLDEQGNCAWSGKFPNQEAIDEEKTKGITEITWLREYLLRIVSETGRVVYPEWIHYYDYDKDLPNDGHFVQTYVGVDLAISEKDSAHRTAIVAMKIYKMDEKTYAYVMPFPFNDNVGFPDQVTQIRLLASNTAVYRYPKIFVEKVSYQESIIQHCQSLGIQVEGVPPHGEKRERIALTTAAIKEGLILFPNKGAEELVLQLIGFGVEKYNDLADAFSLVANQFIAYASIPPIHIEFFEIPGPRRRLLSGEDNDGWRPLSF